MGPSQVFVVATPIGNLEDITLRALNCLKEAEVILCEDTRVTHKLLSRHKIEGKWLLSLKEWNAWSLRSLLELTAGKKAVLVSDSGTPAVSDPGAKFIEACKCPVIPIPGPSSAIAAISVSGLGQDGFVFLGFLHKSQGKMKREIKESLALDKAVVFFESPYRILTTLEAVSEIAPNVRCVLCRELTKIHEEILRGTPGEILAKLKSRDKILGEFTIVLQNP